MLHGCQTKSKPAKYSLARNGRLVRTTRCYPARPSPHAGDDHFDHRSRSVQQFDEPDPHVNPKFNLDPYGDLLSAFTPWAGKPSIIRVFSGLDADPLSRKIARFVWHEIQEMPLSHNAHHHLRRLWAGLERKFGVEIGCEWNRAQHEAFAEFFRRHGLASPRRA